MLTLTGRTRQINVVDRQYIDTLRDHLCYIVTDTKVPWHLPHWQDFMLVSKIIITHVSKSRCKLAVYTDVEWSRAPFFSRGRSFRPFYKVICTDVRRHRGEASTG